MRCTGGGGGWLGALLSSSPMRRTRSGRALCDIGSQLEPLDGLAQARVRGRVWLEPTLKPARDPQDGGFGAMVFIGHTARLPRFRAGLTWGPLLAELLGEPNEKARCQVVDDEPTLSIR